MTTAPALTSFMRVYLPWYVTTHPPASYLPGSHLMLNLHVPSVCCHNTHDSTKYCAVDVILDFLGFTFFKVKMTLSSFLSYDGISDMR